MPSHRGLRIAEAIREVVSKAILFEVSDPRVRGVTVIRVDVSADLRNATIHVSIMGTDAEQNLAMKGLTHATGFLQARVASRLQIRFTPVLLFKKDDSIKKSIEMSRLIDSALAADRHDDAALLEERDEEHEVLDDPDDLDEDDEADDEEDEDDEAEDDEPGHPAR
jgi:ribosome-binding factor A